MRVGDKRVVWCEGGVRVRDKRVGDKKEGGVV